MKLPNSKLLWQLWSRPIRFEIKPSYSIGEKQETAVHITVPNRNVISFISAPSDDVCFLRVINAFVYVTTAHYCCLIQSKWCSLLKTPFYSGEAESLLQNTALLCHCCWPLFLIKMGHKLLLYSFNNFTYWVVWRFDLDATFSSTKWNIHHSTFESH